jgi:hypothetical protein
LSFEQFYELVELVNQVSIALDGDELDDEGEEEEKESEREDDGSDEAYQMLIDAVSIGKGIKRKEAEGL